MVAFRHRVDGQGRLLGVAFCDINTLKIDREEGDPPTHLELIVLVSWLCDEKARSLPSYASIITILWFKSHPGQAQGLPPPGIGPYRSHKFEALPSRKNFLQSS